MMIHPFKTYLFLFLGLSRLDFLVYNITMLRIILVSASLFLFSLASTPAYFEITTVLVGISQGSCGDSLVSIDLEDPATNTTTTCSKSWEPYETIYAPVDWVCNSSLLPNEVIS